jgi:hypothetical protein
MHACERYVGRWRVRPEVEGTTKNERQMQAKLPSIAVEWGRYLLGFGVSVAVGLAPYLGRVRVPLFTPLLSLIPLFVQDIAIPLSSAAMGLVAVFVQWYGSSRISQEWASKMFVRTLISAAVLLLALTVVQMLAVERIYVPATEQTVSLVVGFAFPDKPPCAGLSRAQCIGNRLGLNPSAIETYFGGVQVKVAQVLLVLTYTLFMSSFGALVGLLVIIRRVDRR